jgi:hypothetical protein
VVEVPSPYRIASTGLATIITTEFADLGVVPLHDELHESLGREGRIVGISIDREAPMSRNRTAQEEYIKVQWFEEWTDEVDPTIVHDPRTIADLAYRLQVAIARAQLTYSGDFWYFLWDSTEYPRDPTGNRTRFLMYIRAFANNAQLAETGG